MRFDRRGVGQVIDELGQELRGGRELADLSRIRFVHWLLCEGGRSAQQGYGEESAHLISHRHGPLRGRAAS